MRADEYPRVEDAACGCPRYQVETGVLKVHVKTCAFGPPAKRRGKPVRGKYGPIGRFIRWLMRH